MTRMRRLAVAVLAAAVPFVSSCGSNTATSSSGGRYVADGIGACDEVATVGSPEGSLLTGEAGQKVLDEAGFAKP